MCSSHLIQKLTQSVSDLNVKLQTVKLLGENNTAPKAWSIKKKMDILDIHYGPGGP